MKVVSVESEIDFRFLSAMAGYRETLENAVSTAACFLLDIPDAADRILDIPNRPFPVLGAADDFTDELRRVYRELVCPGPGDNPYGPGGPTPIIPPAFPGQCPVSYTFFWTYANNSQIGGLPPGTPQGPFTVTGPIGDFVNLNPGIGLQVEGGNRNERLTGTGTVEVTQPSFVSVVRNDGQPDTCPGFPNPPVGDPPRVEDPITYDPPTGAPITISPVITFPPVTIDQSNNLIIPVGIAYANFRATANLNLNVGSVNFNFGGGSGGGKDCCFPDQGPENPIDDPEVNPDPPEQFVLSGVIIRVNTAAPVAGVTEINNPNGPNVYVPDLGLVIFRVRIGDTAPYLKPIRIQTRFPFIPSPDARRTIDVSVIPRAGVSLTFEKVFASVTTLGS